MSVIPLVPKNQRLPETVVDNENEYSSAGSLGGKVIMIRPLDAKALLPDSGNANTSYDLHLGDKYSDFRDTNPIAICEPGVKLLPGRSIIIETLEEVRMPRCYFGLIIPRVTIMRQGITNTFSKVDPGYNGKLYITVFNLSKKVVLLEKTVPFCSLSILDVAGNAQTRDKYHTIGFPTMSKRTILYQVMDGIEWNQTLLTAILIIATIILTIVQIIKI